MLALGLGASERGEMSGWRGAPMLLKPSNARAKHYPFLIQNTALLSGGTTCEPICLVELRVDTEIKQQKKGPYFHTKSKCKGMFKILNTFFRE